MNVDVLESAGIDPKVAPADMDAWIADLTDTVVSSLAHGAAAASSWSADLSSAIGKFGSGRNSDALIAAMVSSASSALG